MPSYLRKVDSVNVSPVHEADLYFMESYAPIIKVSW